MVEGGLSCGGRGVRRSRRTKEGVRNVSQEGVVGLPRIVLDSVQCEEEARCWVLGTPRMEGISFGLLGVVVEVVGLLDGGGWGGEVEV